MYGFWPYSCPNGLDAREVTQDTLVRAFQAINQFDSRKSFAPWLFTIARRKCIDHHRRRAAWQDEPVPERAHTEDPACLLAEQEDRRNLWHTARRTLPPNQFQAL